MGDRSTGIREKFQIFISLKEGRQMFSMFLLVDPDRETMALPRNTPLCLRGELKEGLCAPRGPEEAGRTSACSPKEREGFSKLPGALCSHKELVSRCNCLPDRHPIEVWKGAVACYSVASQTI